MTFGPIANETTGKPKILWKNRRSGNTDLEFIAIKVSKLLA